MRRVKQLVVGSIAACAVMMAMASTASASTINFNSTAGSGGFGDGSNGNTRTWTVDGITVTATAWYADDVNFNKAALGQYSGAGLGVCNSQEQGSSFPCEAPNHAVDNVSQYDFVLFSFSQAVDLQEVDLWQYSDYNYDTSFWLGSGVTSLTGKALNNMPAGFGTRHDINNDLTVDLQPGHLTYTSLLFGAQVSSEDRDDRFKIKTLVFDGTTRQGPSCEVGCTPVPEPSSMVLLGTGLIGAVAAARRRRARKA